MQKFDTFETIIRAVAVGAIFIGWAKITKVALKLSWDFISTLPEKETFKPVTKAVCGFCQDLYDDDEYHLIYGTHLCGACR